jgi:hypothetical protein
LGLYIEKDTSLVSAMSASALTYTLTANKGHREPRRKYIFILCAAAVVVLLLVDLCTDGLNELFYEARWPNMTSPVETEPDELRVRPNVATNNSDEETNKRYGVGFTVDERAHILHSQLVGLPGIHPAEWREWVDNWQCVPDYNHKYAASEYNDHCQMQGSEVPEWQARDPYIESLLKSGVPVNLVSGLELAAMLRNKTVFLNGDSMLRQLVSAWLCDIAPLSVDTATTAKDVARRDTLRAWATENGASLMAYMVSDALDIALNTSVGGGGPFAMIGTGHPRFREWESHGAIKMMESLDVIILHFGLHYDNETNMRAEYEQMVPALHAFAAQPGKAVLMLEMGTQHFPGSPDGKYENRAHVAGWTACCAPVELGTSKNGVNDFDRNAVLADALAKFTNIKLIPFHNLTAPRFAMHMEQRRFPPEGSHGDACDCTHLCHSTPFWRAVMGGVRESLLQSWFEKKDSSFRAHINSTEREDRLPQL